MPKLKLNKQQIEAIVFSIREELDRPVQVFQKVREVAYENFRKTDPLYNEIKEVLAKINTKPEEYDIRGDINKYVNRTVEKTLPPAPKQAPSIDKIHQHLQLATIDGKTEDIETLIATIKSKFE